MRIRDLRRAINIKGLDGGVGDYSFIYSPENLSLVLPHVLFISNLVQNYKLLTLHNQKPII